MPFFEGSTGEFDPGIGKRGVGNAVVQFKGSLWVLGSGSDGGLYQTTFTFKSTTAKQDLLNHKNWPNPRLRLADGSNPSSTGKVGADVLADGSELYLFWQQNSEICAAFTPGGLDLDHLPWSPKFKLCDSKGNDLTPRYHGADVSAVAFGETAFLVACPVQGPDTPAQYYIGLFHTANQSPGKWQASADRTVSVKELSKIDPATTEEYPTLIDCERSIKITWSPMVVSEDKAPEFAVLAFISPIGLFKDDHTAATPLQFLLRLGTDGAPLADALRVLNPVHTIMPLTSFSALRDPIGRILGCALEKGRILQVTYGSVSETMEPAAIEYDVNAPQATGIPEPTVAFYIDVANAATTILSNDAAPVQAAYDVYRFIFYGGHVCVQAEYYGQVQRLTKAAKLIPNGPSDTYRVIGYFEGGLPVPRENVEGFVFESDNAVCASVTYGKSKGQTNDSTDQSSVGAGIKSSGNFAVGFGFAYDASLKCSWIARKQTLSGKTKQFEITQDTRAQYDRATKVGTGISPSGTAVGTSSPRLDIEAFRLVLNNKNKDVLGDLLSQESSHLAPQTFWIGLSYDQGKPVLTNCTPYMVTPGDIRSYTPEAINERMASLYKGKGKEAPADYFNDVLMKYGMELDGSPFLTCNAATTAYSSEQFAQTVNKTKTNGWNLDSSVYLGISWGDSEGFGGKALLGTDFTITHYNGDTDTLETGLSASNLGNIPMPDPDCKSANPKSITNYQVLVFFLPPPTDDPNLWATELADFGSLNPAMRIDPGSQPWKVAFVVSRYQTMEDYHKEGKPWTYEYTNLPPTLSKRDVLR